MHENRERIPSQNAKLAKGRGGGVLKQGAPPWHFLKEHMVLECNYRIQRCPGE